MPYRVFFSLSIITVFAAAAHGQLTNGSFDQRLQGWTTQQAKVGDVSIDNEQFYRGPLGLRIEHERREATSSATQILDVAPNTTYTVLLWARVEKIEAKKAGGARVTITETGGRELANSDALSGTSPWRQTAVSFRTGDKSKITLRLQLLSARGAVWFDQIQLHKGKRDIDPRPAPPQTPASNIARGKPYTLSPHPGYAHSRDAGDKTQLTDGVYSEGYFWTQKSTIGWQNAHPATIAIDLGEVQPIRGMSYNSAAGVAGVVWPLSAYVFVSEDNKTWHYAGNLIEMALANGQPPAEGYGVHRYWTDQMRTRGRYVTLQIPSSGAYTFVDEIEIYRGEDAWLTDGEPGEPIVSPQQFFKSRELTDAVRRRLRDDMQTIFDSLGQAPPPELVRAVAAVDVPPRDDFRTVFPLNDLHRRIYRHQARAWRQAGLKGVVLWQTNPWDMLSPTQPPRTGGAKIDLAMMRGETRGAAFNLSNATDQAVIYQSVKVQGLPPGAVTVHEAPFTDTKSGVAVVAALPTLDGRPLVIDAGLTRQVWLSVNTAKVSAGEHRGRVILEPGGPHVPIKLKVYPFDMPAAPTLHVGGWDYTNNDAMYDITVENRDALIEHLRQRYVDTPWATSAVLPRGRYDDQGYMTAKPSTQNFDKWVDRWPDARRYLVFASVNEKMDRFEMNTEPFNRAVGAWATYWTHHAKSRGINPDQFGMLLVDENHSIKQDKIIVAWADAIHAAQPDVIVWQDPTYRDPTQGMPEMFAKSHVLSPNLTIWITQGESYADFFLKQRDAGRELWFYQCSGPGKLLDPYSYHRLQQWFCWHYDAKGSCFWAFGDSNGASSWNEYMARIGAYTPMFLDKTTVTAGKHMEAIREGVQDYETLLMLRDRVAALTRQGEQNKTLDEARKLLDEAAPRVIGFMMTDSNQIKWDQDKDRTVADQVRREVLEVMMRLKR